ncbi:hypothetical protein ACTJJ0_08725 [Chitinophaga sp. 22321]|uniref:Uncharacterized protein n=1 Tax=Chitinophaga hostae TaxID=2831022 RepID=A0ABS5IU03_9BACT|nr:hypothetical protein [Chitinophaga hostae]MBS0026444.1 hypothetical protein [Chitinophaga hostae]
MKKLIIAVMMVCSFLATNGHGDNQELIGIYKSTISRACIVLYKTDTRYRARAYEDFAVIRKYIYPGAYLSKLPDDKVHLDFLVDYSEPVFENLSSKNDQIVFTIPRKNEFNQAVLDFFARAGTRFRPL